MRVDSFGTLAVENTLKKVTPDSNNEETVALTSRVTSGSLADEGRFPSGTLLAGRYRIISLLGRGGMGEVYRATDLTLAQSVALKFLPAAAAANQSLLERFHNEVRVARQVSHPNVCRVYDIGEAEGLPFLSMEYIDGEDLATTLQRIGRLPPDKALETTRKICAGLNAAHAKSVIHRDLKPSNIMLDRRGEVLLTDFGLAAVAESVRGPEARQGTPAYMSPEQLSGSEVTARSDIYSLGLIVYEIFTGKKAYDAKNLTELVQLQDEARPASMSSLAEGIDPAVERAVLRCLNRDPARRPPSALSVSAALPGGDPLAAALAAGETPSPELVAASGEENILPSKSAGALLVGVFTGLVALLFALEQQSISRFAPIDTPPAVLEAKAKETARAFGYTERPADWHSRFWFDREFVRFLEKRPGKKDWQVLFDAESPVSLLYRQSPRPLEALPDGRVLENQPPHIVSGMLRIIVDSRGRLREFSAVPPQVDESPPDASGIDPNPVFQAIGFAMDGFSSTAPKYTPLTPFDERQAWAGKHPELADIDVAVEVSSWRGRITDVKLVWPWTKPTRMVDEEKSAQARWGVAATIILVAIGITAALIFARRNFRAGRGDRAGATRVAAFVFVTSFASWVLGMHVVPSFTMFSFLGYYIAYSLYPAAIVWLLYMALEPWVRAGWPHALISWNRVLAGRWNDPRVGADVLIGMAVAMFFLLTFIAAAIYSIGKGGAPVEQAFFTLNGFRHALGAVSSLIENAPLSSFGIFLLLFGIRKLIRRDYLAALVTALIFSLIQSREADFLLSLVVSFVVFSVLIFALIRFGLVTGIAAMVTINVCGLIIASTDFNAWYNSTGLILWLMLVGLAVIAWWASQRGAKPSSASAA
jgi:hypothetical protein